MFKDNVPIIRQPEQPDFFDLSSIPHKDDKKTSANSQVVTLEPMDIKLSVKLYCCLCPEDNCSNTECNGCDKSNDCKQCECCLCSQPSCSGDLLSNLFYFMKSKKDVPVKEENVNENI